MSGILRIPEGVSIGFRSMIYLAYDEKGRLISAKEISTALNVSEGHLATVMQKLVRAKLVDSIRGPKGGFKIKPDRKKTRLIDVYVAIEGNFEVNDCAFDSKCETDCSLHHLLIETGNKILDYLNNTTILDLLNSVWCKENFKKQSC